MAAVEVLSQRELLNLIEQYANAKIDLAQNPTHESARVVWRLMEGNVREAVAALYAHPTATPSEARDWCTDPDNCQRCKALTTDQRRYSHAGLPLGSQKR